MTSNGMSGIFEKFSSVPCYHLGDTCVSYAKKRSDHNSIVMGIVLWYTIVLDYNSTFCNADKALPNRGRIIKHAIDGWNTDGKGLNTFLIFLDEMNDLLLQHIAHKDGFKGHLFLKELQKWHVETWMQPIKGCLCFLFSQLSNSEKKEDEVRLIRCVRQIASFLKKLSVDRPDLDIQMRVEFHDFEEFLASDVPVRSALMAYKDTVAEMRSILQAHLEHFSLAPFVPGHGSGAVSDTSIKCWYEKHTNASRDVRMAYLLAHADLGTETDYLPLVKDDKSNRTSRFVCVPKTWKKLRGISTEPPELQFWQQGLLKSIDRMFITDKWWASRINLHDQDRSRRLALKGSRDGTLGTVDLSAASDSVTLQLVRDIFRNTELGRWLLGTRSTHTLCDDSIVKLSKFAPMGSACCFPTECMIFCLAAEVAVRRSATQYERNRTVCIYGDDIIVPSYAIPELFEILNTLGFSVNNEKSFWEGDFREACGMEAWRGLDIAPCRFSAWVSGYSGRYSDYDEISALVSLANEFYLRGLHDTRATLLTILFNKEIRLGGGKSICVQDTIFTSFSGECSTLTSPFPTNFNLKRKFDRSLYTFKYKRVIWRERGNSRTIASEMSDAYDVCKYVAWLTGHQSGCYDFDELWSNGWIESMDDNPYSRLPIGTTMVPTFKWVLPPATLFL